MLNTMRSLSKSWASKLLMFLLVASFVLWGIGDIVGKGGVNYAAKVGSETISLSEFSNAGQQLRRQLEEAGMTNIPPGAVERSAIQQLVQQKLKLMAMQDMGLYVNEAQVAAKVADMKAFQDENGKFSAKKYATIMQSQKLPEKVFIGQLKKDIAEDFLGQSVDMSDLSVPSSVRNLTAIAAGETRNAILFTIPARLEARDVSDDKILPYYEANKDVLYMQPEMRTLDYVVLSPANIDALVDATITDSMIADMLAAKPELNASLARIKLRAQQRDDVLRNLSNTIEDELAAGKSMTEAFTTAGIKPEQHSLSNITADAQFLSTDPVVKAVVAQGFGLSEGEISGLIRTKSETQLMVAVKAITPARPKPFEAVKADVATRLVKQLARDTAREKAMLAKQSLGTAPNWQAVAEEMHLSNRVVSNLGRAVDGKASRSDIPLSIQQAIFERKVGDVAGPLALENGDQLIALVTGSQLPDGSAKLSDAQASKLAEAFASDIENRAMQSFATRHEVKVNPAVLQTSAAAEAE